MNNTDYFREQQKQHDSNEYQRRMAQQKFLREFREMEESRLSNMFNGARGQYTYDQLGAQQDTSNNNVEFETLSSVSNTNSRLRNKPYSQYPRAPAYPSVKSS